MPGTTQTKSGLAMGRSSLLGSSARQPFPRSTLRPTPARRSTIGVQSVLEMNKRSGSNGAAAGSNIDAAAAAKDVQREMEYRLAAKQPDNETLYKSVAWSVHNRLLESFESTHAYWK